MNLIDLGVGLVVLVLALRGYRRGLLREVFKLVGWIGGGAAAIWLMYDLAPPIAATFGLPVAVGGAIAFVGVFVVVYVTCSIAGWLISKIVRLTLLAFIDRWGGLALGTAQAVMLCAIVLYVLHESPLFPSAAEKIESSAFGGTLVLHAGAALSAFQHAAAADAKEAETAEAETTPPAKQRPRTKSRQRAAQPEPTAEEESP